MKKTEEERTPNIEKQMKTLSLNDKNESPDSTTNPQPSNSRGSRNVRSSVTQNSSSSSPASSKSTIRHAESSPVETQTPRLLTCHPKYSMMYLAGLLRERNILMGSPVNLRHSLKLMDKTIKAVTSSISHSGAAADDYGYERRKVRRRNICLTKRVEIPTDRYPNYNFVGRLIGPQGMYIQRLELKTGCKIVVRGDRIQTNAQGTQATASPGKTTKPYIVVKCLDTESRVLKKLENGVKEIEKLLVPPPDGQDYLKRKQLYELSRINGTYEDRSHKKKM